MPTCHTSAPTPARKGLFLSIEGIDGAGKSSHLATIAQALEAAGHTVVLTREPGGTPLAEKIRALLLHEGMDARCEALLAFAARRQHLLETIVPALEQGHTVVSDRFTDATFAYQGAGRGVDWAALEWLEQWVQTTPAADNPHFQSPDCTLWFDLPPAIAAERLQKARAPDRFEAQTLAFFTNVAAGYARRAQQAPQRFCRIDAHQPIAQVATQVRQCLAQRGYLSGPTTPPEHA